MIFSILSVAIAAGLVQGTSGFGGGILMMMVLPLFFTIPQSAGISTAVCLVMQIIMVYQYREQLKLKDILLPVTFYMITSSSSVVLSSYVDPVFMKKVLGVFFLILASYYLFFSKQKEKEFTFIQSVFCVVISGLCDGLFGIGGPLMVIYFLHKFPETKEYLGNLQMFFLINGVVMTIFRIHQGIILPSFIPGIIGGAVGICIGLYFATQLISRINGQHLRKFIYILIGISGILNIL